MKQPIPKGSLGEMATGFLADAALHVFLLWPAFAALAVVGLFIPKKKKEENLRRAREFEGLRDADWWT